MDKVTIAIGQIIASGDWDFSERRQERRYSCLLEGMLYADGEQMACEIFSLSKSGIAILCERALDRGALVVVECPQPKQALAAGNIRCRVGWVEPYDGRFRARLTLVEPRDALSQGSWLSIELSDLGLQHRDSRQRRRAVRVGCDWPVKMKGEGWRGSATLIDLGMSGARISCPGFALPEGSFLLSFCPPDTYNPIVVLATMAEALDLERGIYRISFTGYQVGGENDLMRALNVALSLKRQTKG